MKTKELFEKVYLGFSMNFFHKVFNRTEKEEDTLTKTELFCMEVIYSLGRPTVNEFASYIQLTSPNAAYKVNRLVQKGYLNKERSDLDKRVYYLTPTKKYIERYAVSRSYVDDILMRAKQRLSREDWNTFGRILQVIAEEQEKSAAEGR